MNLPDYKNKIYKSRGGGIHYQQITTSQKQLKIEPPPKPLFNPNIQYTLQSCVADGMVLDISQGWIDRGQLIIWKKNGQKNQKFRIVHQNKGKYQIVSCFDMRCLSVERYASNAGASVYPGKNIGCQSQFWEFEAVKNQANTFYIKSMHGKYMDVEKEKKSGGTPIIQWDFHGKFNQKWKIIPS